MRILFKILLVVVMLAGLLLVSYKGVEDIETQIFTINGVSFTMINVDGGTFQMGATIERDVEVSNDEMPMHSVTLSDYWIGETEVTQALWQAVMGTSIEQQTQKVYNNLLSEGISEEMVRNLEKYLITPAGIGPDYPMYNISYDEIVNEFIPELNRLTGKKFRLPTEAEWEFAARGGKMSLGYKYAGGNKIDEVAWYWKNSGDTVFNKSDDDWDLDLILNNRCRTHIVKTKLPNELGLYDMCGNVWEWCSNRYGEYVRDNQTNPKGPLTGDFYVARGGSWLDGGRRCRVTNRGYYYPFNQYYAIGMRLVLIQ